MKPRLLPVYLVVSAAAVAGIASFEGYRSRAYDDGAGVQTVGFGTTTREDGSPVRPGDTITPQRAVVRLAQDADRIGREIAACIGAVPLYQHEFDAFVSLAYNIGSGAFCRSTLVKRLKQTPPDYAGACREILRWQYAGGRVLPGLVKRREAEYRQCIGAETP
ncbi:MAG: lysozyme [Rhodocyclaceae bacterium]